MKLKLDLHDVYNRGQDVERAPVEVAFAPMRNRDIAYPEGVTDGSQPA